jgi:hypothetical protein
VGGQRVHQGERTCDRVCWPEGSGLRLLTALVTSLVTAGPAHSESTPAQRPVSPEVRSIPIKQTDQETHANDFVLSKGGEHIQLLGSDINKWRITFADIGIHTAIGERLRRVRP